MSQEPEWPDYTPLKEMVEDSDGLLTLDFAGRIEARLYITYEDGEWCGVSVGPFGQTDDGVTAIKTKELDIDESEVVGMLDNARMVQLRPTRDTPIRSVRTAGAIPEDDEFVEWDETAVNPRELREEDVGESG